MIKELGIGRPLTAETMLSVSKFIIKSQMFFFVAYKYMLKGFAKVTRELHCSIISSIICFTVYLISNK